MVTLSKPCGVADSVALRAQASRLQSGLHPSRATPFKAVQAVWEYAVTPAVWQDWQSQAPPNPARLAQTFEF
eukprot:3024885-Amphidinium_carterae.1